MIETDNLASRSNESPYRVLAWWDVDMHIGAYKKHKLTARPLRWPGEAIFQAERFPDHEPFDGMFSILLTRGQAQE
ncbi:hypothetical protein NKI61_02375 [Mesorhizobium sp. M0514]|uniref:hypothetical protein n=1 Tax=Mesorhizobium sp. M0514 TaxID=2956955 RepID=UPI0033364C33